MTRRDLCLSMAYSATAFVGSARAQDVPRTNAIEPYFIRHTPIWKDVDYNRKNPIADRLTLTWSEFSRNRKAVYARMRGDDLKHIPDRPAKELADLLQKAVEKELETAGMPFNDFARQWLLAEGICRWVLLNTYYDYAQVGADGVAIDFARQGKTATILGKNPPAAVCGGFSCLTRDLGRACGLKCYKVDGHVRSLGVTGPVGQNHSITMFEFFGGIKVPADVAAVRTSLQDSKVWSRLKRIPTGPISSSCLLPVTPVQWEIFLAQFYTWDGKINGKQIVNWDGDLQGAHFFHDITFLEWQQKDTTYLKPLNLLGAFRAACCAFSAGDASLGMLARRDPRRDRLSAGVAAHRAGSTAPMPDSTLQPQETFPGYPAACCGEEVIDQLYREEQRR